MGSSVCEHLTPARAPEAARRGNQAQCSLKLPRPPGRCSSSRLSPHLTRDSRGPLRTPFRAAIAAPPPLGGRFNAAGSGSAAGTARLPRFTRLRGDALGKHRSRTGAPRTPSAPGQRPLPAGGRAWTFPPPPRPGRSPGPAAAWARRPSPGGPDPAAARGAPRAGLTETAASRAGHGRAVPGLRGRSGSGRCCAARAAGRGGGGPARPPRLRPPPRALKAPAPPRPGAPGTARPCPAPSAAAARPRGAPAAGSARPAPPRVWVHHPQPALRWGIAPEIHTRGSLTSA